MCRYPCLCWLDVVSEPQEHLGFLSLVRCEGVELAFHVCVCLERCGVGEHVADEGVDVGRLHASVSEEFAGFGYESPYPVQG